MRRANGGVIIDVIVTPKAKVSGVQGMDPWRKRLIVKVRAMPTEGRANDELCGLLDDLFGVRTTIISGRTDRLKTVFVPIEQEVAESRLEGSIEGRGADAGRA